jgi:pyruvate dehydrogenase E1 component alpha subunit
MMTAHQTAIPDTLTREHGQHLLREMMRIRRFEEKCAELYTLMKVRGFVHLYIGEEAIAVGAMQSLTADDSIVATYREHGQALARGIDINAVMAEMFGKIEGCSMGRGGSMHIFDRDTRFYGGNAIVGGGIPLAVGIALADKMRGLPQVTACFFGDGAVAEGEFHESMNLASLWQLPVLFYCENNRYAMGTAVERAQAEPELVKKAAGYRIPAESVDGMDVLAVEDVARRASEHVRSGSGPYFVEFRTYRFRAHSMYDPELYRDKAEVEEWKKYDPIDTFAARLREAGLLSEEEFADFDSAAIREVDESVEFAEAGELEPVEDLTRFVYSEPASHTSEGVQE